MKKKVCGATRALRGEVHLPIVRSIHQFGPSIRHPESFKLFLDDVRNPPFRERDWVVVRNVDDGHDCLLRYGDFVTEISFDNDLGSPPEGIDLLYWVMNLHWAFPKLKLITIHSGNLRRVADMRKLLRGSKFKVRRRVPDQRTFPHHTQDPRPITPYTRKRKYQ